MTEHNYIKSVSKGMTDEKQLIPLNETTKPSLRYFLVIIPVILYYNGEGLSSYVVSEWIHHWVKSDVYPNGTFVPGSKCEDYNSSDPDYVMYKKVESEAAMWITYNTLAISIPGVVSSVLLPSYSDSLGRRFLFVIGVSGFLIKCIVAAVAIHFNLSPIYAICGSMIEGLGGAYYLLSSAVLSYIADCTVGGRQRTVALTAIDGIEKLCMTTAGLAAGYYISAKGYFIPMCTSCALATTALLLHIFVIPESHPKALRSKTFSVIGNLRRAVDFYTSNTFKHKRLAYLLLIVAYFLSGVTTTHRTTIELIYQLGRPFCWSYEKIGNFGAARHATQGLIAMFLVKPLKKCFSELQLALYSTGFKIGSYVLEGLARTDLALYMVPVLATFANLALSMIKSMMSLMTPADKQGALFASIFAVYGICGICAPFVMNTLYANTVSLMSGLVFLVLAGISCVGLAVLLLFWVIQKRHKQDHTTGLWINQETVHGRQ